MAAVISIVDALVEQRGINGLAQEVMRRLLRLEETAGVTRAEATEPQCHP